MLSEATAFEGVRAAIILKRFKLGDKTVSKYTLRFDNCIITVLYLQVEPIMEFVVTGNIQKSNYRPLIWTTITVITTV